MTEPVTSSEAKRCPIDFDLDTTEHALNWPAEFREIREQCPRAWTDKHGGFWIASKFADIVAIAQRSDVFSTHKSFDPETGAVSGGVIIPPVPSFRAIPNESDPPEWNGIRGFINRRFAPRAVEQRRAKARQLVGAVIDKVIETGRFDFVDDLANPLPALVTMDIFGFPLEEWRQFADPFHKMIYTPKHDPDYIETVRGLDYFKQRVDEEIAIRRSEPGRDDLLGYLASGTIDGQPLDHQRIQDLAFNIMGGGVDTTTALTANTLLYLSRHPEQRQRLIDEPRLLPLACEEFVRYFSPIHGLARNASEDVEVNGWHFNKGDRVLLAYASGNRAPDAFDEPEDAKLDRIPNKHIGFGAGMHRCLGSFLARMMFEVMIDEILSRMPDYRVIEDRIKPYTTVASVNGWIQMPATFTPGFKVGAVIT